MPFFARFVAPIPHIPGVQRLDEPLDASGSPTANATGTREPHNMRTESGKTPVIKKPKTVHVSPVGLVTAS